MHLGRTQGSEGKWYFKNRFFVAVGKLHAQRAECLHCWLFPPLLVEAPGNLHASPGPDVPLSPWGPDVNVAVQPLSCPQLCVYMCVHACVCVYHVSK